MGEVDWFVSGLKPKWYFRFQRYGMMCNGNFRYRHLAC
jgi:hypothetical protein